MTIFMLLMQLTMADWSETVRKQNYLQCVDEVSDFKDGFLEDPVLAHDTCVCVIDVLEQNVPEPHEAEITKFVDSQIEKFYPCRDEYQRRRQVTKSFK